MRRMDVPSNPCPLPGPLRVARHSALSACLTLLLACSATLNDGGTPPGPSAALAVQVSGLPAGTGARVTVSGPGGYSRLLTATTQLSGLSVGVYHVAAGYVDAQGQTWTGQSSADSVVLGAGDSLDVVVTYVGGPAASLNLSVGGVQLIQSTQRADNTVPMVAHRDALLRVFVTADAANTVAPVVRVRVFNGVTPVDSLDVAAPGTSVPLTVDTASLSGSWNVLIPAARVVAGLALQVEVDPGDAIAETDETDNRWPGSNARQAVAVQVVPAFNLRFVPVRQAVNNLTGQVSNANKDAFVAVAAKVFPLAAANTTVRSVYTTSAGALDANDSNGAWAQILNETSALQAADGSQDEYVSIVATTYASGIAGLGWVGAPAAVAWDKAGSAPGVIAHELGHNFGRLHAPCGNPSGPDASYPYAGGGIGTWGVDLPGLSLKSPATLKDLMSYCQPQWISDYTYLGVLGFRGAGPDVQPRGAAGPGLLVWGRIQNGAVILEPSFVVNAPARLPGRAGPHRVEGLDGSGNRVFSVSFEGTLVPDLPGGEDRQFAFVVPLSPAERVRLAGVRLVGEGLTAFRRPFAGLRSAGAPPTEQVQAVRSGGEVEVRWDGAYPLAVIRDAESGEILALGRNGVARLPPTAGAWHVELSEGVSSIPGVTLRAP
jgi:hypothetical protein